MTALELIFVLFLVLANGFFVAAEFALVKVRLSQIEQLARAGSFPARVTRNVLNHLDAYLSACQLGITWPAWGWDGWEKMSGRSCCSRHWLPWAFPMRPGTFRCPS